MSDYLEDLLFSTSLIEQIELVHELLFKDYKRHYLIPHNPRAIEVDAVATFLTRTGKERLIGFELKKSDYLKAFKQAEARKHFFDYFYIVMGVPAWFIQPSFFCDIAKEGIGLICGSQIIIKARYSPRRTLEEVIE